MEAIFTRELRNGDKVEIGGASWDPNDWSIRIYRRNAAGGFSRPGSPEVPLADWIETNSAFVEFTAQKLEEMHS